jgi:hypothetical protein
MEHQEHKVTLEPADPPSADHFVSLSPEQAYLACRVDVRTDDFVRSFRVVLSNSVARDEYTLGALQAVVVREAPGTQAILVTDSGEGWAYARVLLDDERALMQAGSAVAAVCASWGWDESAVITVRVNDVDVQAATRFDGDFWSVVTPW